jgi:hypothetical protein
MEGGAVGHNFERDPPRDHPKRQIYLIQLDVVFKKTNG